MPGQHRTGAYPLGGVAVDPRPRPPAPGPSQPVSAPPAGGPYDGDSDEPTPAAPADAVDFGSIRLALPAGGSLAAEPGGSGGPPQAVHIALPAGRLSVSALASPKSAKVWPDLAKEIDASLREGGARVRSFTGDWGRELHATTGAATSLFLGVDGPRWMLYGVATGPTSTAPALAEALRRMLRGAVVVRGRSPYPVRTVLPLTVPPGLAPDSGVPAAPAGPAAEQPPAVASPPVPDAADGPAPVEPDPAPDLDPIAEQAPAAGRPDVAAPVVPSPNVPSPNIPAPDGADPRSGPPTGTGRPAVAPGRPVPFRPRPGAHPVPGRPPGVPVRPDQVDPPTERWMVPPAAGLPRPPAGPPRPRPWQGGPFPGRGPAGPPRPRGPVPSGYPELGWARPPGDPGRQRPPVPGARPSGGPWPAPAGPRRPAPAGWTGAPFPAGTAAGPPVRPAGASATGATPPGAFPSGAHPSGAHPAAAARAGVAAARASRTGRFASAGGSAPPAATGVPAQVVGEDLFRVDEAGPPVPRTAATRAMPAVGPRAAGSRHARPEPDDPHSVTQVMAAVRVEPVQETGRHHRPDRP